MAAKRRFSMATFISALTIIFALVVSSRAEQVPAPLVSAEWLKANLGSDNLVIIDIRGRSAAAAFEKGHIPGAVWSRYPGQWRGGDVIGSVPSVEKLATSVAGLGISNDTTVVIVLEGKNSTEFGGAARVYWSLKYLGHDAVAILDGGWRTWSAEADNPIESGSVTPKAAIFVAKPNPDILATTSMVEARLGGGTALIDSRAHEHYNGKTKAAAVSRPGHIPSAVSLDNAGFYDGAGNRIKPGAELRRYAARLGLGKQADIIAYCNAGHWSATNWFVLHELLGYENVALYVDSMVGWAKDPDRPVDTGAPEVANDIDDM